MTNVVKVDRAEPPATIASYIASMQGQIEAALPEHIGVERFARLALNAIRRDPTLQKSTPESFIGALLTAAALGLEPGLNNEAHLVAYRDGKASRETGRNVHECQLIVGYGGVVKLFWQHPHAKRLESGWVGERDEFSYSKGLHPSLDHRPALGDRGEPVAYWALAELTAGGTLFEVFSPDAICKLRGGKIGPKGDIADPEHWMERKTATKQLLKLLPKSTQLIQALDVDERRGSMDAARAIAQGVAVPKMEYVDAEVVVEPAFTAVEEREAQRLARGLNLRSKQFQAFVAETLGRTPDKPWSELPPADQREVLAALRTAEKGAAEKREVEPAPPPGVDPETGEVIS